jgi:hypothetical protein
MENNSKWRRGGRVKNLKISKFKSIFGGKRFEFTN